MPTTKQLAAFKGHLISCLQILYQKNPNYYVWLGAQKIVADFSSKAIEFWLKKTLVTSRTSLNLVQIPIFHFKRQYLTIMSNIGVRSLAFLFSLCLQSTVCYICTSCIEKKILHQSFGILWYKGHVGAGRERPLPCDITICFCMLS